MFVLCMLLYCAEAFPMPFKYKSAVDALQLQYIRWCLGLSNRSPRRDTLAEVGQRPISYLAAEARVKYFVLVRSRDTDHISADALRHYEERGTKKGSWLAALHRLGGDRRWSAVSRRTGVSDQIYNIYPDCTTLTMHPAA